ncbi:MAG TPA: hypothetical protein EYO62_01420 [Aquificales bacterium]|nr:hypothetical protein [Aquificales bacterium]HIO41380.1 hypothetical protein [Aquifex sp.]
MTGKKGIVILLIGLVLLLLVGGAYWLVQSKFGTRLEKSLLKITGGEYTVYVYPAGAEKPVKVYHGKGYVWFEESEGDTKTHTGVVTFKTSDGKIVRIGAWGGVVIVEYK